MNKNKKHKINLKTNAGGLSNSESFKNYSDFGDCDRDLSDSIDDFFRAENDIREVMMDPAYNEIKELTADTIRDYSQKRPESSRIGTYIADNLKYDDFRGDELRNEVSKVIREIGKNDLNKITSEWVQEWHSKKQSGVESEKAGEMREFITGALKDDSSIIEKIEEVSPAGTILEVKLPIRRKIITYLSAAAAAISGIIIVISSLSPGDDTGKLYSSYYTPYEAVSPVTRSSGNNINIDYVVAIESYISGNYEAALSLFSGILQRDDKQVSASFYLALALMEMDRHKEAVPPLVNVIDGRGDYVKEAKWYLGLAYYKTGEKAKALECFKELSSSPGYYSERSGKILRRLK